MTYYSKSAKQKKLPFSLKFWALTVTLILFYTTLIFAQNNIVYIDPTTTNPVKNGTIDNPYSSWQGFPIQSNTTYLTKRGTSFQLHVNRIEIDNKVNVTFGAYGVGDRPIIYSRNSNAFMMMVKRSDNVVIRDLHFTRHPDNTVMPSGIYISGHNGGSTQTTNTSIINCELSYFWGGVRGMPFSTGISNITIDSTIIHHIDDDGVFIVDCDNVTIKNSHIYLVNLNFWKKGVSHNEAPGDCIHLVNDCDNYLIENNILDRRHTGNKFAFIYGNTSYRPVRGRVIGNTIYPPKDTIGDGGGSGMYFSPSQFVEIAYNKWIGRGYDTKPVSAAHITPDTVLFYYNSLDSVQGVSFLMSDHLEAYNNTLITNADVSFGMLLSGIPSGEVRNNIVAVNSGNRIQNTNSNNVIQSNNALFQGSPNTWNNDIGIVDWATGNFNLTSGSNSIDAGFDYSGYYFDQNNTPVPQGTSRDVGAFEFPQGGAINNPPNIENQIFQVEENSPNGTLVGTIVATDPDNNQTFTFSIIAGNTGNTFAIASSTGQLTIANNTLLDFETNPVFALTVEVADNGIPVMTDQALITINLLDVNEAPVIDDQLFLLEQFSPNGTEVGTIVASDPDIGQSLTYSILSGNTGNTFEVNPSSGLLTVADNSLLDMATNPVFVLTVQVEDNGTPVLTAVAGITIELFSIANHPPVIDDQLFLLEQYSPNGTQVGTIVASDPDIGQLLTYSILSRHMGSPFSVHPSSGLITVANNSMLNMSTNPVYVLTVQVEDNGTPVLTDVAYITIELFAINHPPVIDDQLFLLEQFSPNGTEVGTIVASDPDIGQSLTYSILSRHMGSPFAVNTYTGLITLVNSSMLDMSINPVYVLTVQVEDNGTPVLTDVAYITIELFASGPDNVQTPTYKVLSGNTSIDSLGILGATNFSNNEFRISIYPNPAVDYLNIDLNDLNTTDSPLEITILNLSGEMLEHQVYYTSTASFSKKIDVSMLSKGVYIVIVQYDKVSKLGKIMKH